MRRFRTIAVVAALAVTLAGCSILKDPREPWQVDVTIALVNGVYTATPSELKVDGPYGFVVVFNDSAKQIGFAIDEPAVYEKINPDAQTRVDVDELEDGKTYPFFDFVNDPKTKRTIGTIVVHFVAEEER